MDRWERLLVELRDALASPSPPLIAHLERDLERARPAFKELLDVPPRDSKEKDSLQQGWFDFDGKRLNVSDKEFTSKALQVSEALGASEFLSAGLLHQAIPLSKRFGYDLIDTALLVHCITRANRLRCIQTLIAGAASVDNAVEQSGLRQVLAREADALTIESAPGKSGTWIQKLISALETCLSEAKKLQREREQQQPGPGALMPARSAQQQPSAFSSELQEERINHLYSERAIVGEILFFVAVRRQLNSGEIIQLTKWLADAESQDTSAVYILTALMSALDTTDADEETAGALSGLVSDATFLKDFAKTLNTATWRIPPFKSIITLQWCLFLSWASRQTDVGMSEEQAEAQIWSAIDGNVFAFIARSVLAYKWDDELRALWGDLGGDIEAVGGGAQVERWFQENVTRQVELLVIGTIVVAGKTLARYKRQEEDMFLNESASSSRRASRGSVAATAGAKPHRVIESLLLLVATIQNGEPDRGLTFWSAMGPAHDTTYASMKLMEFLRWGAEFKVNSMARAFYAMLSYLADGPTCAGHAFKFLNDPDVGAFDSGGAPTLSWSTLFAALEYIESRLPMHPGAELQAIPDEEVELLKPFMRLLITVVTHSDVARAYLYNSSRYKPFRTFFTLLLRPIPIELKAAVFSALAAFCRPGGGSLGTEIARNTWTELEQSQILPTQDLVSTTPGVMVPASGGGILIEIERVEVPNRVFPESTAFVRLLTALVHTPKAAANASSAAARLTPHVRGTLEAEIQAIPDGLGAAHRTPGVEPYVSFVVDDILQKAAQRDYADPSEKWRVTDTCLAFVENCLGSCEFEPLVAHAKSGKVNMQSAALLQIVQHPSFDILCRILSGGSLLELVITLVNAGLDAIERNLAGTKTFTQCMLRCLRIIYRTLELQPAFLELVVPLVAETGITMSATRQKLLQSVSALDQRLLYAPDAVVQIALLVGCEDNLEIALVATRITGKLADSPYFDVIDKFAKYNKARKNRLVSLFETSQNAANVRETFMRRLEENVAEVILEDGEDIDSRSSPDVILQAIRSSIIDILLRCTGVHRQAPNLAHYLLGFLPQGRTGSIDYDKAGGFEAEPSCLQIILALMRGVEEEEKETNPLAQNGGDRQSPITFIERHPAFASKCYQLVRQLCTHDYTSAQFSRFLRAQEDYFVHQSRVLPFRIPEVVEGAVGSLAFTDGGRSKTSYSAVCSVLLGEASLLDTIALELSTLAAADDTQRAKRLVASLFGNPGSTDLESDKAFQPLGARSTLPRLLEAFYVFDFVWEDDIPFVDRPLQYFGELNYSSCLRPDASGCAVYDLKQALALLRAARRDLHARGVLDSEQRRADAQADMKVVIERLMFENHSREIAFARTKAIRAWRNALDITLTTCWHLVPVHARHTLLLDALSAVLPPITAPSTETPVAEILSGAGVMLMIKLREDSIQLLATDDAGNSVAPDRLHVFLRAIISGIVQPGSASIVRGNLYAVMLNYIQYCASMAQAGAFGDIDALDDAMSMASTSASTMRSSSRRGPLDAGNLRIFQSQLDRLLPVVCRDAAIGVEVWRTVAFSVLDTLAAVVFTDRASSSKFVQSMSRQGYLRSFVDALKDADVDLQETLKPDPPSLNALYVYGSQMSFFIRLSSTREGAERLVEAGFLTKLAQCGFLGLRPNFITSMSDYDGFLPQAAERHHELLMPALQAAVGCLHAIGADSATLAPQLLNFVAAHREPLVMALRDTATVQALSLLQQSHLVITLLAALLPHVPEDEINTYSAFGGLHSAVLSLTGKLCGLQSWIGHVSPSSETEREDSEIATPGLERLSNVFDDNVTEAALSVETAILTYHSAATRKRSSIDSFRPVWLPSMDHGARDSATATMRTATTFLENTAESLSKSLKDLEAVVAKTSKLASVPLDELESLVAITSDSKQPTAERKARAEADARELQGKLRTRCLSLLHALEVALLLYLRHVAYFLDPERPERDLGVRRPDAGAGLQESMLSSRSTTVSLYATPALREAVADAFEDVSDRVKAIKLSNETVGSSFKSQEAYLETVSRRIRDLVSLDA